MKDWQDTLQEKSPERSTEIEVTPSQKSLYVTMTSLELTPLSIYSACLHILLPGIGNLASDKERES